MIKFRKVSAALLATVALFAGAGIAAAEDKGAPDLFAFSEGARLVAYPDDVMISQMDSSPLNLIDGSAATDWSGQASPSPVFVIELPERTELSRISFDAGPLNRDAKAVKSVTVEVSDTSATSGFETVAAVTLKRLKNDQSFSFDPEFLPVGRWVRLTVVDNFAGDDYSALTGFHGYGRALTDVAEMPDVTGTYEGHSGWGKIHLTQQGDQVTGCYAFQNGRVTGVVKGRTMILTMLETGIDGSTIKHRAYFGLSANGRELMGMGRNTDPALGDGYFDFYAADRLSNRAGSCG
jgi:hypothetical protein